MVDILYLDNSPNKAMFLAKALYDNVAETPDELPCRRGDVLTIVEVEPSNLEGWWLCSLRGRRGIIPANRLRSLATGGQDPGGGGGGHNLKTNDTNSNSINNYDNTMLNSPLDGVNWKLQNGHNRNNQMMAPDSFYKHPPSSDYDVPKARSISSSPTPQPLPPRGHSTASLGRASQKSVVDEDTYDVPRASLLSARSSMSDAGGDATYDVPRIVLAGEQGGSDLRATSGGVAPTSARSSLDNSSHDVYDIPPAPKMALPPTPKLKTGTVDTTSNSDVYDTPPKTRIIRDDQILTKGSSGTESDACYDDSYSEISDMPLKEMMQTDSGCYVGDYVGDNALPRNSTPGKSVGEGSAYPTTASDPLKLQQLSGGNDYDVPQSKDMNCNMGDVLVRRKLDSVTLRNSDPHAIYDIPPHVTKDSGRFSSELASCRLSGASSHSGSGGDDDLDASYDQLRLDLDSALDLLVKLQQEVHSSCARLLGCVSPRWRQTEKLEPKLYSIRLACLSIKTSLEEYIVFIHGVLANARLLTDSVLRHKLSRQLRPLQDDQQTIVQHLKGIETKQWVVASLVVAEQNDTQPQHCPDELDGIVSRAREIPPKARALTLLIQGNAKSLFTSRTSVVGELSQMSVSSEFNSSSPRTPSMRQSPTPGEGMRSRPLPPPPGSTVTTPPSQSPYDTYSLPRSLHMSTDAVDKPSHDYDYVQLSKHSLSNNSLSIDNFSTDEFRKLSENDLAPPKIRTSGLSPKFKERIEALQKEAEKPVKMLPPGASVDTHLSHSALSRQAVLHENDQQILTFYADQVASHCSVLANASHAFMQCIEYQQPPKVFIAHSKFVVLAAHKLVYIGDTITRNLLNEEVRHNIMMCGNRLCDKLKSTVVSTKNAALNFPSSDMTQQMIDKVADVSLAASHLQHAISLSQH